MTHSYSLDRIAWELESTALGRSFYGNALRVARDISGVTDEDRQVLDRFATGLSQGTDHVSLQDIARCIRASELTMPQDYQAAQVAKLKRELHQQTEGSYQEHGGVSLLKELSELGGVNAEAGDAVRQPDLV